MSIPTVPNRSAEIVAPEGRSRRANAASATVIVGSRAMRIDTSIDCVYFKPLICNAGASVKFRTPSATTSNQSRRSRRGRPFHGAAESRTSVASP